LRFFGRDLQGRFLLVLSGRLLNARCCKSAHGWPSTARRLARSNLFE
jgi:hypothetical protein